VTAAPWWKGAVVYQVYLRSFCDADGDGHGDLPGLIGKLDYIASLGVDAVWLSPIHPSPNRDWGYDASDYENVHPDYGTLDDFARLIEEAHARGLKIILDEVLAHTSDEHAWFKESLDARGAKADWYVWADPKLDGTAPNNWLSEFGGAAWSYQPARRQYYHHKFLRQQPKLNWNVSGARDAALHVLDNWLKRGADGFRLDVANAFLHDATLADNPPLPSEKRDARAWSHAPNLQIHLHDSNLPGNAKLLDAIRRTVEKYGNRFVFGEFFEDAERSGGYLSAEEGLHAGYTFGMITANILSPDFVRDQFAILARHPAHWPCVSFSNHDVPRTVTRFGGGAAGNPALAKLLLAVLFALRGTVLLYQGEELGLPQVDLRRDQLRDPVGDLYYPIAKGRDGCRTPMPWNEDEKNLGFSSGTPWLPLGETHRVLAVSRQERDPNSTLNFARACLALRKAEPALRLGDLQMLDAPPHVLAFTRTYEDKRLLCVFNMGENDAALTHDLLGQASALPATSGWAKLDGRSLSLGPLAVFLARL
jgi:alpha-glucosidase